MDLSLHSFVMWARKYAAKLTEGKSKPRRDMLGESGEKHSTTTPTCVAVWRLALLQASPRGAVSDRMEMRVW